MPKATKKAPVKPVAPTPPPPPPPAPEPEVSGLPILYPTLVIDEYSSTSVKGPLDATWCKAALGWETEKEYQARKVEENPGSKPEHWLFGENGPKLDESSGGGFQPVHCRNTSGTKVVCWNNANNRPFDEGWCESLVHTILSGQWAGPFTVSGETVNGETVRISRYGRVLSGQHQMSACILADEILSLARANGTDHAAVPKYPAWVKCPAPFIETVVIKGVSEDSRVLMTVDYNKPRSVADVFYTSGTFKTASSVERKELCRMLAIAVDVLWTRTGTKGYRTHPECVAFLDRHKRLLKATEYLFGINRNRRISNLRLTAGTCAALLYLQGSSGPETDGDIYRNEEPPSEKNLDWSYWDRAVDFWSGLANSPEFVPVREALGRLVESSPSDPTNQGLGGRTGEKLAIVAKAWDAWKDASANAGPVFAMEDLEPDGLLCLSYSDLDSKGNKLPDGQVVLLDDADFYGIDCPESLNSSGRAAKGDSTPPTFTPEELERAKEEAKARRGK